MKPSDLFYLILLILIGFVPGYFLGKKSVDTVIDKVPVTFTVKQDSIIKVHDTIHYPVPIPGRDVVDSTYYRKYISLKDSISKLVMYTDAVTIHEYTGTFSDSIQDISVFSKSRGDILEQTISYSLRPRSYTVSDSIPVPVKYSKEFLVGGDLTVPVLGDTDYIPVIGIRAGLRLLSGDIISVGVDTDGNVKGGILFKLDK